MDLKEFVKFEADSAQRLIEAGQEISPYVCALLPNGSMRTMPLKFGNRQEKQFSAGMASVWLAWHGARAVVFVSEAWAVMADAAKIDLNSDLEIPPSQHPHRKEILSVTGEMHNATPIILCREITRIANKRTVGEYQWTEGPGVALEGRFGNLLPTEEICNSPCPSDMRPLVLDLLGEYAA